MAKKVFGFLFSVFVIFLIAISSVSALTATVNITANFFYHSNSLPNLTNYNAPLGVFFNGWQSSPRDSIVRYTWYFGDGQNMSGSGMFNAAHVYEVPGNYTFNLTIMDNTGANATTNGSIIVTQRTGVTYYVDPAGSDSNNGSCATANATCAGGAWQTADKAFAGLTNIAGKYSQGTTVLFKAGGSYNYSQTNAMAAFMGGVLFTRYGAGADPIIQPSTSGGDYQLMGNGGAGVFNLAFVNLTFQGNGAGQVFFPTQNINNIVFERVNITRYYNPILFSNDLTNANAIANGVIFDNLNMYNATQDAMSLYGVDRFAVMNSFIDHGNNHLIYSSNVREGIFYNNVLTRPPFGRAALRVSGGYNSTIPSDNIYLSNNFFGGWVDPLDCTTMVGGCGGANDPFSVHNGGGVRYNINLLQFSPQSPANQTLNYSRDEVYYMMENNIVTNGEVMLSIGSAENMTIRNNIFATNSTNGAAGGGNNMIQVGVSDYALGGAVDQKPSKNVMFWGNTLIQHQGAYSMIRIENYSQPTGQNTTSLYKNHVNLSFMNNIFYVAGSGVTTSNQTIYSIDKNDSVLLANITTNNNVFFSELGLANINFNVGAINATVLGVNYNFSLWNQTWKKDNLSTYGDEGFYNFSSTRMNTNLTYLNWNLFNEMFNNSDPNLIINSSSVARATGTGLSSILFYDMNNFLRTTPYDIGAYDYQNISTSPPPTPPVNVTNSTTGATAQASIVAWTLAIPVIGLLLTIIFIGMILLLLQGGNLDAKTAITGLVVIFAVMVLTIMALAIFAIFTNF